MTTKQKLEAKIKTFKRRSCPNAFVPLNEVDSDIDYYSDMGKCEGIDDCFDSLAPLLLEMVELIQDIEPSVLASNHRNRRHEALDKFNKFLEGENGI